ncbi:unnamed protein product, partial [Polarella glacialis]
MRFLQLHSWQAAAVLWTTLEVLAAYGGRGPPVGLLEATGDDGPLTYLAATAGRTAVFPPRRLTEEWIPIQIGKPSADVVDYFSKGSTCSLELMKSQSQSSPAKARDDEKMPPPFPRWSASGSNCQPHLHCPLWAPLAVAVVNGAASMSTLLWIAMLDGRPRRRFGYEPSRSFRPRLIELWASLAESFAWGNLTRLIDEWLLPEYKAVGLDQQQALNMTVRALLNYDDQPVNFGNLFHLPPHLCFTCCMTGLRRARIILVRSPFARIVSYFRARWLHNPAKVHNTWKDFPLFVEYVAEQYNSTDAYTTLALPANHGTSDIGLEFTQEDLRLTRSITELLRDAVAQKSSGAPQQPQQHQQQQQPRPFYALHVEHVKDEIADLASLLCNQYDYCEGLPTFPHVKMFKAPVRKFVWRACWSNYSTVRQVLHRFRQDFDTFGYSMDPLQSLAVEKGIVEVRRWPSEAATKSRARAPDHRQLQKPRLLIVMADTREPELGDLGLVLGPGEVSTFCPSCKFQPSARSPQHVGYWTKHYVEAALLAHQINASFKYFKCTSSSNVIDAHWCKVSVLKQLLAGSSSDEIDLVVYLDTDVTVAGQDDTWVKLATNIDKLLQAEQFKVIDARSGDSSEAVRFATFENASIIAGCGDACGSFIKAGIQDRFSTALLLIRPGPGANAILSEWSRTWPSTNRLAPYFDQAGFNLLHDKFPSQIVALAADHLLDVQVRESCIRFGPLRGDVALDAWRYNNNILQKVMSVTSVSGIHLGRHREKGLLAVEHLKAYAGSNLPGLLARTALLIEDFVYDLPLQAAVASNKKR